MFGRLALSFPPAVQNRLELLLVELSHAPEGRPAVEEVKLFVVLVRRVGAQFIQLLAEIT